MKMSRQTVKKRDIETLGPKVKEILKPEICKLAEALSTVLGYKTFDDYVAACVRTNVQMFIEGGADIYERFHNAYGHLGYESSEEEKKSDRQEEEEEEEDVIAR